MVLNIDLNDVPDESRQVESIAAPTDLQHGHPGSEPVDDDVTLLTATEWYAEARSQPRRLPGTSAIDENLETNAEHSGVVVEEPMATLCPDYRNSESLMNSMTSGSVILTGDYDIPMARNVPRRRRSVRIAIDENFETNAEHSGIAAEERISIIYPDCRNNESLMNRMTSGSEILTRDYDAPMARSQPKRRRPVTIAIDENLETTAEHSGSCSTFAIEERIPIICPDCRNNESLMNRMTGDFEILTRDYDVSTPSDDARQPIPMAEQKPSASALASASASASASVATGAAEASALMCPVCMSPPKEPASTTCGHVFCTRCIVRAIEKQKKCPTCRKKLTKKNFHRIFLPYK